MRFITYRSQLGSRAGQFHGQHNGATPLVMDLSVQQQILHQGEEIEHLWWMDLSVQEQILHEIVHLWGEWI